MADTYEAVSRYSESEIDLRAILRALKRRRSTYIVPTIIAFILVGIYVNVVTKRYTAQAQLLLENQETFFTRPDRVSAPADQNSQLDEAAVSSQVQLIMSPDLARRAIQQIGLVGNPEFDPRVHFNPLTRVLVALGIMPDPARSNIDGRVVDAFLQKLTVYSPTKTRIITIEFTSRDPVLAARIANKVADLYIQEQSAAKRAMASAAADSLSAQIGDLRAKLAKADKDREQYRSSSGLLVGQNNMTISDQQLADINGDLSKARSLQADAQAKASMIRDLLRSGQGADVAEVTNNDIVRRIWDQRAVAQAQLALESRTLLPQHPRIKELTAQVAQYDAALKSAAKQAAQTLENEAVIAGQRVANLEAVLNRQKNVVDTANGDEIHLRALDRIAQGYKDQLESSMTKYEEAIARQSSMATPADARVISRAQVPQQPSFPKKIPFTIFATLAALFFSVLYVVASELLSGGSTTVDPRARAFVAQTSQPVSVRSSDDAPSRDPGPSVAAAETVDRPLRANEHVPASSLGLTPARRAMLTTLASAHDEERDATMGATAREAHRSDMRAEPGSRGVLGAIFGFMRAFGRSAAESGKTTDLAPSLIGGRSAGAEDFDAGAMAGLSNLEMVLKRIVAAHVPGRGLHIVSAAADDQPNKDQAIVLGRSLAARGRTLIIDLGSDPAQLATLWSGSLSSSDSGAKPPAGLSELLAGNAGFAEAIHRDHGTRMHFIPAGAKEADFRDFDLVLDALSETYDFIVLLTPAATESDIAKVMAPYANFVVLTRMPHTEDRQLDLLRSEMVEAGARDVLVFEPQHSAVPPVQDVA